MKKELIVELFEKAKDFAIGLTSYNVIDKELKGEHHIAIEHVENNIAFEMLIDRDVNLKLCQLLRM